MPTIIEIAVTPKPTMSEMRTPVTRREVAPDLIGTEQMPFAQGRQVCLQQVLLRVVVRREHRTDQPEQDVTDRTSDPINASGFRARRRHATTIGLDPCPDRAGSEPGGADASREVRVPAASRMPDPRIGDPVGDIRQQIRDDDGHQQQREKLRHRVIPAQDRIHQEVADPRPLKDRLHDQGVADEPSQPQTRERDQRIERIAEDAAIDDRGFGSPLARCVRT